MSIRTRRNSRRFIAAAAAVAVAVSTFATTSSPVSATATAAATRYAGADRYATSVAVATNTVPGDATAFVIASGDNFPDALAASALAGAIGGRIILVPSSGELSVGARVLLANAIIVYIVGGTSAIPVTLEATLIAAAPAGLNLGGQFIQRISGATRYETAAAVAAELQYVPIGLIGLKRTAIVTSGENFADAVSAAPLAYRGPASQNKFHPLLLTEPGSLNASTAQRLVSLGIQQVVIVGGTTAVSAAVATSIEALGITVIRVGGANRYDTAAALANVAVTAEAAGGFGWPKTAAALANLAPAGDGADALAAAPWLGNNPRVLLGVNPAGLPAATAAWLDANKATIANITVFGGTASVPATVVDSAATSAGKTAAPTATIAALEGATALSITFSEAVVAASATNVANYSVFNSAGTKPLSSGVYNATTRTVTFAVAALAVGDFVRVLNTANDGVLTADGRKVAAAEIVVAADTSAPVGTLTALVGIAGVGTTNAFAVSFDKPVKTGSGSDLVAADFTVNGVAVSTLATSTYTLGGVGATAAQFDTLTITLTTPAALIAGQTVTLAANKVSILGAAAATVLNAAVTGTVVGDASRPTIVGTPVATLAKQNAVLSVGSGASSLTLVADKALTSGLPGNDVALEVFSGAALAVTVTGTDIDVTVTGTTTAKAVADAINANTDANQLVTASFASGGLGVFVAPVASANLAGGSEAVSVVFNFSEAVALSSGNFTYDGGGAGVAEIVAANAAAGVTLAATRTTVTVVFVIAAVNQRPTPNAASYALAADVVKDLAGNPNAAVNFALLGIS